MSDNKSSTENTEGISGKHAKGGFLIRKILLALFVVMLICPLSVFLIERPRYLKLPIKPPDYYRHGTGGWDEKITYSIEVWSPPIPPLYARYFVLRKEALTLFDEEHGIVSAQSIVNYFDERFSAIGWEHYKMFIPQDCYNHLPESAFLDSIEEGDQEGFVTYRPKGYKQFEEGPIVCIAIWPSYKNKDGTIMSFQIVFLTSRPSPLTYVSNWLELP